MDVKDKIITGLYTSIGGLGAIHSGTAHEIYNNPEIARFMSGYQHDITAPMSIYFAMKFLGLESLLSRATLTYAFYSAGEIAQGLGVYPGTFDPKDFLAYGAGIGLAVAIDKITFRKKNLDTLVDEPARTPNP